MIKSILFHLMKWGSFGKGIFAVICLFIIALQSRGKKEEPLSFTSLQEKKILQDFDKAYKARQQPRIVIFVNRELSEEFTEWKVKEKVEAKITGNIEILSQAKAPTDSQNQSKVSVNEEVKPSETQIESDKPVEPSTQSEPAKESEAKAEEGKKTEEQTKAEEKGSSQSENTLEEKKSEEKSSQSEDEKGSEEKSEEKAKEGSEEQDKTAKDEKSSESKSTQESATNENREEQSKQDANDSSVPESSSSSDSASGDGGSSSLIDSSSESAKQTDEGQTQASSIGMGLKFESVEIKSELPEVERSILTEADRWKFETGFLGPFINVRAKTIDRATIVRQTGFSILKEKNPSELDRMAIEMEALNKYADICVEVMISEDKSPSSITGYIFRATAKDLKTGEIIGQVVHPGNTKIVVKQQKVKGIIKKIKQEVLDLDATSKNLCLALMEQMALSWSRK